jgi:hypothetical protein
MVSQQTPGDVHPYWQDQHIQNVTGFSIRNPQFEIRNLYSSMPPPSANDQFVEGAINLRDFWRALVRRRFFPLGITCIEAYPEMPLSLTQPAKRHTLPTHGSPMRGMFDVVGTTG